MGDFVKVKEPKRPRYYASKPNAILQAGTLITDKTAQALYYFLYLTGGRINEVTDFTKNRLDIFPDRRVVTLRTLKQRRGDTLRKIPIPIGKTAQCQEDVMWEVVSAYLNPFDTYDKPFRKWGNMSVYIARHIPLRVEARVKGPYEYIDKVIEKRLHPHYLRHCRATHLVNYYHFTDNQLCHFFGWRNPMMALEYTKSADVWQAFLRVRQ